MKLNYGQLVKEHVAASAESGEARRVAEHTRELFKDRAARDNFSVAALFEGAFGFEEFKACRADRKARTAHQVFEAAGAVNTAAFQNILGQWAFTTYLDAYDAPELVFKGLIPTVQTQLKYERIPGISPIGDVALVVDEAKQYPIAGVSENYIETPETLKRGFIVPVTWEALFFDRTNQLRQRVTDLGTWMGVNREKRAIDCVIDAGETAQNRYRYRWLGNTIATYGDSSGTHNWDNLSASNPLTTYSAIQTAWTLAKGLTDPYTGEPIDVNFKDLIVPPSLVWNTPFVTGGQLSRISPGYATTGSPLNTTIENPTTGIIGTLRQWSSQLLQARMTAASIPADTWWLGDVARAFVYMENLAPEVTTAPAGSEAEFTQDIVLRTKVREMGTYATKEPRAMIKATA